ncbi:zinc-alpha-2-glycoprotein-like isoform X5 [Xyrauchen texanus]|uniref:zinc-alpha-2-glycoprotein-like isoform X5 n=1 Tax=Xyrauchen texanus TaxID=154827 RepID=UPI0022424A3A|nr:zinc-alpha-2-glycoprotein-like isoform X5 [Xyrauchen texanus]
MGALIILYFLLFPSVVQQEKHSIQHQIVYSGLKTSHDTVSGSLLSAVSVCDDRQIANYSHNEGDWISNHWNYEIWRDVPDFFHYRDWFPYDYSDWFLHEIIEWFLHQIHILSNCTNSKCSELHVLQGRAGCEVEKRPDGEIKNLKGFNEYQYDGEDFIVFNFNTTQWIKKNPKANETILEWDHQTIQNQIIKNQLKNCMNWISTFNNTQITLPDVEVFAVESPQDQNKLILTCLATGFYPKHLEMNMMLNGIKLDHVNSSGIRPNGDETFQLRISVEIHRNETEGFECRVNHISVKEPVKIKWGGECSNCSEASNADVTAVAAVFAALAVFFIVIFIYILIRKRSNGNESSIHEMLLNSLTLQKLKKVLSDDSGSDDEISKHQSMDNLTNVHETQSLDDIRLNPAEDLTAARGFMGSNNSLPNFAMKRDSSDPHQNTVTQNALLLAPQKLCRSIELPPKLRLDRNDPHQNTVTQNALLLAPQRRCASMGIPLHFSLDRNDPHQNTVTQNPLLLAPQKLCRSIELPPPNLTLDRNDTSDSS